VPTQLTQATTLPRILLIDDDPSVSAAVQLILEHDGYAVVSAGSGEAGLELMSSCDFDLAIVDIFMPGLGGLETIARIRRLAPDLPVVATSGTASRRDRSGSVPDVLARAADLGTAAVIYKPFRPRDLVATIERCLAASSGTANEEVGARSDP
jgi:two-component system response regulator PilR (NtrC family)